MKRISIDMGSGFTKIYMPGCGVVLKEATCIAVEEGFEDGEKVACVKACGDKARALSGRAAVTTHIVNPIFEGDIVNENLASLLLEYCLEKIEITRKKAKRVEAVFILPCGAKAELKQKYMRIAEECGLAAVYFTVTPFAAVLGHNVAISESTPMFVLDIGHSITNIAALSQDGIIYGLTVNLGGANVDVHLIDELAENYNLKIGALTAERLKISVGSLLPDDNKMNVIEGREISSGAPASIAVTSEQIYGVITTYIDKILEYADLLIKRLPEEVAATLCKTGIALSGGVCCLSGFAEYVSKKLQNEAHLASDPVTCAVLGGGRAVGNAALLQKIEMR